ncbi:MAG: tetratricopeptide repeat protein [Verrucomicrobiota bacterium]|jgi:tetratricopeptide (TPR) repeat protein
MSDSTTEEGKAAANEGGSRWTRWAVLGAVCALVVGFYAWSAKSGVLELTGSGPQDSYYNLQVRGFRDGQLNVKREAPPGLAQPGAPAALTWGDNVIAGSADLSYYKGKLYLYFGVTPALLLFWPYAALTGHYLAHKDAVVIFFSVGFLAGAGLLCAVWRRYFKETSLGVVAAGALALGLANLTPAILEGCDVYEVAISCGYALTMLALAGVWGALQNARRRLCWLAAASLAYGLAVGARPSLLFGAVILLVPVAQEWRERRRVWPLLLAAGGPIVAIGVGLMVYNALRFDNPLEFGQRYQLPVSAHQQFSPRFFWFNFRVGFLELARWSLRFPFVHDISPPTQPTRYFGLDHPFGVLTNMPVVWMALAAPLVWRGWSGEGRSPLRWFFGAVALLFAVCALTLCLHDSMYLRYELEYASPLMLLAVVGILALERGLPGRPVWRRAARCGWGLLLALSVAFNLFASFQLQADTHTFFGDALLQKGNVDEAISQFQTALRIEPDNASAHNNLGNALEQKGRLDEAILQYHNSLQLQPEHAETYCNLGNALLKKGSVEEAIRQLQKALQIKPDFAAARYNLGNAFLQSGSLDEAITQYQKALEINLDYADAHHNLGTALLRKGRVDEAITQYQDALQIKPDLEDARHNLGMAYFQKGDLEKAIECYQEAIKINPRSADAYANLGLAFFKKREIKQAVDTWEKALVIKPEQLFVLNNLAWLLATTPDASLRDGARAVTLAKQADQLGGNSNPMMLHTLAAAYAETGDYALAAATARRGLDLAVEQKNNALAATLQREIQLYEAQTPLRDEPR